MSPPRLEEVFKTNGVPTFTFVEPFEYTKLLVNLRTHGRGLVVEGPSGIGKTSAVETALRSLNIVDKVTKLSARKKEDVEYLGLVLNNPGAGVVIVDDFHRLPETMKSDLADRMKTLADEDVVDTKIVIVGINKAGERLVSIAHDLVNRIDIIRFEANPEHKVKELVQKGQEALNIKINVAGEIISAAQGSFYVAQMLCLEVCIRERVLEGCPLEKQIEVSFESIKAQVIDRLSGIFLERCKRFSRGSKLRPEGRAPYLHILNWLATGDEWTLSLPEAIRQHQALSGSVGQVVEKEYLDKLIKGDSGLAEVMHYDGVSKQLSVEDPQFVFFIRNLSWNQFAKDVGYRDVEFKNRYDFALSFAGQDRFLAAEIFKGLQECDLEVFYDANEQHRIAGEDIEEYLLPIYQSEARYILPLLGREYPQRIWAKIESEAFKERFKDGDVIPILFADVPQGMFDTASKHGGYIYDPSKALKPQVEEIVQMLRRKLADE